VTFILALLCVVALFLAILSNARQSRPTMAQRQRNVDRAIRDLEERVR
jgi:uncharacterized membrane protein